jgi:hypothetical protein
MIEPMTINIITGTGITCLVAVNTYFLKRRNEKIDSLEKKIDTNHAELKIDIKNNKEETVKMFQDICHERQGACGKVFDEKLAGLRLEGTGICKKVERIKEDRREKWQKQDKINEKVQNHIAKTE